MVKLTNHNDGFVKVPDRYNFVLNHINNSSLLWRRRGIWGIFLYLFTDVVNLGLYDKYVDSVRRLLGSNFVLVDVRDYEMLIDLQDLGISKRLYLYGTWENKVADLFEEELSRLRSESDDAVVVDIGSNIGYYSILEAKTMGEECDVIAIEPAAANIDLLRRNIDLNGVGGQVSVHQCAIGSETGSATLQLSNQSNLHRIEHERVSDRGGGAETTQVWALDEFIEEHDRDPDDVSAVRMDLEGYELEVLQGMSEILNNSGPLLLYIEIHNNIFNSKEASRVPRLLSEAGFEIVAVEYGTVTASPFDLTYDTESWDELEHIDQAYSLLAKK